MSLTGKRIAITGAFGSLGAAVVKTALAAGAKLAAIDRADAPPAGIDLGQWAAWTAIGNVLLNLDETITKG